MVFLLIFGSVIIIGFGMDFTDNGDCVSRPGENPLVRKPYSSSYYEKEFCIIINT